MARQFGLIAAHGKPKAAQLAAAIRDWLRQRQIAVVGESELDHASVDMLVTIGGDGLIMRAAHVYPDIPILGINMGHVGFLAMIEEDHWQEALAQVLAGEYVVQESPTLSAHVTRENQAVSEGWAINDVVVRAGLQMIDIELYIDGQYVNTYPGDGMIIATPQGSTAYCMAAGGPVLSAGVKGFAVTPICAHSPIRTTLVVPEEAVLELLLTSERDTTLVLDGQPQCKLQAGDLITVQRGMHRFLRVVLPEMNFYQAFRSKFNFQIRPDARPSRPLKLRPELPTSRQ